MLALPCLFAASVGCSSADFAVASAAGDASTQDTATLDAPSDAAPDTAPVGDDGAPVPGDGSTLDGGVVCSAPAPGGDLYVDETSTAPAETGSQDCPFKTIQGALTVAGVPIAARTVHVHGGTTAVPLLYVETGTLRLRNQVTLVADTGAASVRVQASGTCSVASATFGCVMQIDAGATLDGFIVDANGNRDAIVTSPNEPLAATIKNSVATGCTGDGAFGIRAFGSTSVGPAVAVQNNGRDGVHVYGNGIFRVVGGGPRSVFSKNGGAGINVEGGLLQLQNAVANDDVTYGVRIASSATGTNRIDGLEARNDLLAGVFVGASASLTMRNSTLLSNRIGIVGAFGTSNVIDLGGNGQAGGNVLGGAGDKNSIAGACFSNTRLSALSADGDSWSTCPAVVQVAQVPCTFVSDPGYADVYLHGTFGSPPMFSPGTCMVGP